MTLLDIRQLLVQLSGRYDLVKDTETFEDSGADFFINAGVRLLDRLATHPKSFGYVKVEMADDQSVYSLPDLISVSSVEVMSKQSGRVSLSIIEEEVLTKSYRDSCGIPSYYSIHTAIRSPISRVRDKALERLSIRVFPRPMSCSFLIVHGRVSKELKSDEDYNWWTLGHPETLVRAALYQIESFHRNTQGMNDFMNAILVDIRELNNDAIESEMGSANQMNDSFYFRSHGNIR